MPDLDPPGIRRFVKAHPAAPQSDPFQSAAIPASALPTPGYAGFAAASPAMPLRSIGLIKRPFRWNDYITPSTLQLAPLLELLLEPIRGGALLCELQLGLQEVLVNAVRHGNGCDPGKCLRVRRILTPNWVIWQVQDEGRGLPPQIRRGCLPAQADAPCGRGLFLIHHCFDDVRWSARGNRLQVAVRRQRLSGRGPDSPDP